MTCRFAVFADSRGQFLKDEIVKVNNTRAYIEVYFFKGAGVSRLTELIIKHLESYPDDTILLLGGICDVTVWDSRRRCFRFPYKSAEEMTSHIVDLFEKSSELLSTIPNSTILYCQLVGMDLQAYKRCADMNEDHQHFLDNAVCEINRKITALNERNAVPTPWTGCPIHKFRRGKIRHLYMRLTDGIHPSRTVLVEWAKEIVRTANNTLSV